MLAARTSPERDRSTRAPSLDVEPAGGGGRAPPDDWPAPGDIDLAIHDLPHASASIEWWYVKCHLTLSGGVELSLFAAFFRLRTRDVSKDASSRNMHHLVWGIVDPKGRRYLHEARLDPRAPAEGLDQIDRGGGSHDPRMRRALREVFARGRVPLPDRLLRENGAVSLDRLELDYDGNRFVKRTDGSYALTLSDAARGLGCELVFRPKKPATRHGTDGVTSRGTDHEMFYYFVPRCDVAGTVTLDGACLAVDAGTGWYDHEFGSTGEEGKGPTSSGLFWNWIAVQLDGGWEVSAFEIVDDANGQVTERRVVAIDPSGARSEHAEYALTPLAHWTSSRTFNEYPTHWRFEVPALDLSLVIDAELEDQEFITLLSPPAFWEGRVRAAGSMRGLPVRGLGFVERTGFSRVEDLDGFFSAVGAETLRQIDAFLPTRVGPADALRLIADEAHAHYLDGLDLDEFTRSVVTPIREVTHRGGKSWRSYGLLASIEAVGGDSRPFRHLLALPEILHTGSLIVDDVEDLSEIRRGGPSCHALHGVPLAINAGSAAYFLALAPMHRDRFSDAQLLYLYEAYLQAMRAAHAGQALDIRGFGALMPRVVESGDSALLEDRILAVHRIKSAVPPSALARLAATLGGGSPEQVAAMAALFEALGLAFQIIDDVLNLRGFEGDLKRRGEDLSAGKVTFPVAKAMSRLGAAERRRVWSEIERRPDDASVIAGLVETLESCGALEACSIQARALVESAGERVDPLIADSYVKVRLRSFGWFVLERHY